MADRVQTLVVREASGVERVIPAEPGALTIGRDPACAIHIDSPYVSRRHARIEVHAGGLTLVDLGSHNGSLRNGVRVQGSAALEPGDVIAIGDATVTCVSGAETAGETRTFVPPAARAPAPPPVRGAGPAREPAAAELLRVDAQTYEVWIGERPLARRLSAQEFQLLSYLYAQRQRVCTRQELGDVIWGADNWDPNMLHRLVHRLKEKLEPNPDTPRYIQTLPWIGYRITP